MGFPTDGQSAPPNTVQNNTTNQAGRFLSLPWIVLIFVFGFLPWSEVSCNARDIHLHITQSGYQTIYGGVGSSYNVVQLVQEKASAEKRQRAILQELGSEALRSAGLLFSVCGDILGRGASVFTNRPVGALEFPATQYCGPLAASWR